MSSDAINLYIGNHNAASISDFVEFLSIEANDAGMRPVITHQLFPDTKNIVKSLKKITKKTFKKNLPKEYFWSHQEKQLLLAYKTLIKTR